MGRFLFRVLVYFLVFTDVVLATLVFMVMARPDIMVGWVLRKEPEVEHEEDLFDSTRELERLRRFARLTAFVGLVLLAGWSYLVGSLMTLGGF